MPDLASTAPALCAWVSRRYSWLLATVLLAGQSACADAPPAATASGPLAVSDSAAAWTALVDAGERIPSWEPALVAERLLEQAEAKLARMPKQGASYGRANHLIRSASDALQSGDAPRAVRRALYALQIADGKQITEGPEAPE